MMTLDAVLTLARLRERAALERIRLAIVTHASEGDWAYVLAAIDVRLCALAELLQREDPQVVRDCEQRLNSDIPNRVSGNRDIQSPTTETLDIHRPPGRIH